MLHKKYVIIIMKIDSENREKRQTKDEVLNIQR